APRRAAWRTRRPRLRANLDRPPAAWSRSPRRRPRRSPPRRLRPAGSAVSSCPSFERHRLQENTKLPRVVVEPRILLRHDIGEVQAKRQLLLVADREGLAGHGICRAAIDARPVDLDLDLRLAVGRAEKAQRLGVAARKSQCRRVAVAPDAGKFRLRPALAERRVGVAARSEAIG